MNEMDENFLSLYLDYTEDTECPITFHRWSALSLLGAWIGPNLSLGLGHFTVKPNLYVMLMGSPGTRKSTAIKIAAKLLRGGGYKNIAANRSTKEKFLLDLAGVSDENPLTSNGALDLEANIFGVESKSAEILIAADEFNGFIGNGNIEFLSMLGDLWDYTGPYENRVKNSKSVVINDPVVSILAGNTPTGFSLAFPVESIGQGIFSRLLLIHGEPSGKKITFPKPPPQEVTVKVQNFLLEIHARCNGVASLTPLAESMLDEIYKGHRGIGDVRFESYSNRRFTHLLKLCLIVCASRVSTVITEYDVLFANTILTHAEHSMPQALGSFGKAKHSDVSHKILQVLETSQGLVSLKDLWIHTHTDLEKMNDLADLLRNLVAADKIIQHGGGFLIKRKLMEEVSNGLVDFTLLTDDERRYVA